MSDHAYYMSESSFVVLMCRRGETELGNIWHAYAGSGGMKLYLGAGQGSRLVPTITGQASCHRHDGTHCLTLDSMVMGWAVSPPCC